MMSDSDLKSRVYGYLAGKNSREQNADMACDLVLRHIKLGSPILDCQCPNPKCKKPIYYVDGFGPACSGDRGGCGLKAPAGKRMPFGK